MKNEKGSGINNIVLRRAGKAWTASGRVQFVDHEDEGCTTELHVAGKTQAGAIKNLEEDAATLQSK